MLALLGMSQVVAQDSDYIPFVREGVKWVCYYMYGDYNGKGYDQYFKPGRNYFTLELKGDAEIDGKVYKALHKYSGESIDSANDTVLLYLREEDKIVYGIVPEGKLYPDCLIGYGYVYNPEYPFSEIIAGNEFVLYDFKATDEWCQWIYRRRPARILDMSSDVVGIGGQKALRHKYAIDMPGIEMYFIEGIGVDGNQPCYPLFFMNTGYTGPSYYLSHVVENGETIYKGVNHDYIAPWDGRVPIVRDGMKWVNERVVISKGDTTRSYYTYELSGYDISDAEHSAHGAMYCHYYTGSAINPAQDSIICSMWDYASFYTTYASNNHAMARVVDEQRNLMGRQYYHEDTGTDQLYWISREYPEQMFGAYYTWQIRQDPKIITRENFKEVDPVMIEGRECCRYAYLGEDGEPLAYIVEGIGFDSRDMGDLLTPFTRQPDPNADYQEYCGLSHVIKDGEIIYKGLRYDASRVEGVPGDVNGDGTLSIDDVTSMIDLLLRGGNELRLPSDLDSNGRLTIDDVTLLIDKLLSGE